MNTSSSIAIFVVGCIVAISLQVYFFSPIHSPEVIQFPPSSPSPNSFLQQVIKLGEGSILLPEDVCFDKNGVLYTATRDGWIKKLHKDGSVENWKKTDYNYLLGITQAKNGDYFVVCELEEGLLKVSEDGVTVLTSEFNGSKIKFRCLKYWLEGDKKGKIEVFVDNLPGGPDNIHLAPDGSFWIALVELTRRELEFVHKSKVLKHILATFPSLGNIMIGITKKTMVVNVNGEGQITRRFDDPEGKVVSFVTAALEYEDHLYLGSLNNNFVGKLPLNNTT